MSVLWDPAEVQGKANIASMFYVSQEGTPWHGLGSPTDGAQTAEEALILSGQNWTVRTEGIVTASGIPIDDGRRCRAIVREDTNTVLGVTGRRYRPIQNKDAFDFLDGLAAERVIRYHTAGVLGKGERIWILGQLAGDITIPKTDEQIKKFLLFCNSHDGTAAGRCLWTPIRVVCQNTLNRSIRQAKADGEPGITIRHTGDLSSKIAEAQRILGLSVKLYDDFERQIRAAAKVKISPEQRRAYFRSLYGPKGKAANQEDGATDEVSTQTRKTLERLEELFETGRGNDQKAIRGSWWAAYNSITENVDHHTGTRLQGAKKGDPRAAASNRLENIWMGDGAKLKERAWDLVLEGIGINN
jgi:phage/plasmid-like protein (TIGR03299 family)